jgi:hypothetical protein
MTEQDHKNILAETVRQFGRQEWFRDAVIYNSHPTTGAPTLEIKVNYVPIFERKVVMDFAQKFNLTERFTVVDRNGKPTE